MLLFVLEVDNGIKSLCCCRMSIPVYQLLILRNFLLRFSRYSPAPYLKPFFQQILNQTKDTTMLLQDLRSQLAPITASLNKSLWFSDDDNIISDHTTQTDEELSPLIIKPKRYNRKKSVSPLNQNLRIRVRMCLVCLLLKETIIRKTTVGFL